MQTIKEKTIYITTDGTVWFDRKQAEKWQNHLNYKNLNYKNKEKNKVETSNELKYGKIKL